jgi:hypothetical protein
MEDDFMVLDGFGFKTTCLIVEVVKAHVVVENFGRRGPAGYMLFLQDDHLAIQRWKSSSTIYCR